MQQQPAPPPHERLPDDGSTHTKRDDRVNDHRTHHTHPDDDRLTEADLDRHERERRSTHAHLQTAT
jgi:hypothetical protein